MSSVEDSAPRRERKKQETRERLQRAAEGLFAERGYHATSMDDIASHADVARATAFNYFPRKDAFLDAWVQTRRQALAALLRLEEQTAMPTDERLRDAFGALADALAGDAARSRALVRAWVQAGGSLLPDSSATAEVFAETLRHGQKRGDVRSDVDTHRAGRVLLDAYVGALVRWAAGDDDTPLREALHGVLTVTLNGVAVSAR